LLLIPSRAGFRARQHRADLRRRCTAHLLPRAVRTPRALSAAATPRRLATPLSCTWRMTGATFSAKRRAALLVLQLSQPQHTISCAEAHQQRPP
jgi:hypothetical protein